MSRAPSPRAERSISSVSSVTQAPSQIWSSISSRRHPVFLLSEEERLSHAKVDRHANRDLDVPLRTGVDEVGVVAWPMSAAPLLGQLRDRLVEEDLMIKCVVRAGVPRSEHGGERLLGPIEEDEQRMEAEAVLVLCTWQIRSGELREPTIGSGRWWWWWRGRQSGRRWACRG